DAAKRAERTELAEALALEAADWKELARSALVFEIGRPIEQLGHRAAYNRLAGNLKEMDDALAQIRKMADPAPMAPAEDEDTLFYVAKALFLNQRPKEALE